MHNNWDHPRNFMLQHRTRRITIWVSFGMICTIHHESAEKNILYLIANNSGLLDISFIIMELSDNIAAPISK